ncbi:crossover junction endodeoxyribonuclease RuvC [bacterium]|nr:crossover junction endodeoxyribonuclease RuvC [bacterium]
MRIIGIDPGIQITGYSVIDCAQDEYTVITSGSIQTSKNQTTPERLLEISKDIKIICEKYKPDVASVEELFFFKNQKTIIPVAEARGVILSALCEAGIEIAEYTPMQVKLSLTGHGRATKPEVKAMVERFVTISPNIKLDDTIDSIAIAICHHRNIF